jgi:branched-chain amino acid transport system permease protein
VRRALGIGVWLLAVAAGLALFAFLPHFLSDFHSRDLARAGVFFIAIVGLNLLTGYTGQISLGHGALMAIGGYTTAALVVHEHWRDVWTIPLAGVAAGIIGFVIGLPALRLSGIYLALATFGFAVAMPSLLKKFSGLTGGTQGLRFLESSPQQVTGLSGSVTILGHSLTQNHFLYYLTWSIGIAGFAVAWLIVRGRLGRVFRAVRDSETAAVSSGVNLAATKTLAFASTQVSPVRCWRSRTRSSTRSASRSCSRSWCWSARSSEDSARCPGSWSARSSCNTCRPSRPTSPAAPECRTSSTERRSSSS